jgi:hypothetical protein
MQSGMKMKPLAGARFQDPDPTRASTLAAQGISKPLKKGRNESMRLRYAHCLQMDCQGMGERLSQPVGVGGSLDHHHGLAFGNARRRSIRMVHLFNLSAIVHGSWAMRMMKVCNHIKCRC